MSTNPTNFDRHKTITGNSLKALESFGDNSFDSIVTDPPYGLKFMSQKWDHSVPTAELWAEVLRVLKPGGHCLSFFGSRTYHRGVVQIEDAGFEIRDQIMWVYGSGMPKSHNISNALGKAGNPEAQNWEGWGTGLKPAHEPIVVARKPFEWTVAQNVSKWGTGGLNIDGARVDFKSVADRNETTAKNQHADFGTAPGGNAVYGDYSMVPRKNYGPTGRFPANLIHDGSQEVLDCFPGDCDNSADRFFYCAKPTKKEKNAGTESGNIHPTVKPVELMRYLCRMVTPPNGLVLDPFMGSGTTGVAALQEGFAFVGVELDPQHTAIADARIRSAY